MERRIGQVLLAYFLLCSVCTASDRAPQRTQGPVVKIDSGRHCDSRYHAITSGLSPTLPQLLAIQAGSG